MNLLFLYNSTQTFTNAVYEHLASFGEYSSHRVFYVHADPLSELNINLSNFDAVGIHFSIRLPFDQVSASVESQLKNYSGLKFLFIQDEYDYPKRVWYWIRRLEISLVFTVVPEGSIETVYPKSELPSTRFVSNLTGYVPEKLPLSSELQPPSKRPIVVGYRGRPLPVRYGRLGIEKVAIGQVVKHYCDQSGISSDIAWSEQARIYGPRWYEFIMSCRAMLGSESGSNVFDWDGTLSSVIDRYRVDHPRCSDEDVYKDVVQRLEIDGLMNQVSPRVFEAIAARTVLVLFEGNYSGVLVPWQHFIPLKKDGSNLDEVFRLLHEDAFVDAMANRAWQDVIGSGKFSYKSFVSKVDYELDRAVDEMKTWAKHHNHPDNNLTTPITTGPVRAKPPQPSTDTLIGTVMGSVESKDLARRSGIYLWWKLPESVRTVVKPRLKRLLRRG